MIRHRKGENIPHESINFETTNEPLARNGNKLQIVWQIFAVVACFIIFIYLILGYLLPGIGSPQYERLVQSSSYHIPDNYWGTFRPGVYFGLKTREPQSPVFGLMWYELTVSSSNRVRHWCEDREGVSYQWLRHDGVSFGEQKIRDSPYDLTTSFVHTPGGKHGGQWTARINLTADKFAPTLLFQLVWYVALDRSLEPTSPPSRLWIDNKILHGYTPQLKNFKVELVPVAGGPFVSIPHQGHLPGLQHLREKFITLLMQYRRATLIGHYRENEATIRRMFGPDDEILGNEEGKETGFVAIDMVVEPLRMTVFDVVFTTEDLTSPPLKGEEYDRVLEQKKRAFDDEFEDKFKLRQKGYSPEDVAVARIAFSNLIGSLTYSHGQEREVDIKRHTRKSAAHWKLPLYSAVPSRTFYPRGFLWDEGFHGLLIGRWSPALQMEIAAHWLDLMNVEGWIPKELGSQGTKEFVAHDNEAAKPPMLLIQLAHFVKIRPDLFAVDSQNRILLDRMFSTLQKWYDWFQNTHRGQEPTSYRWRLREDDGLELNPKTPTSGLDDYPRASHPSPIERHVDLRCWMFAAADAMATIAHALEKNATSFESTRDQLGDEELLNELHWSPHTQTYADYGNHTDEVVVVLQEPEDPSQEPKEVWSATEPPQPRLVTSAFGYVSLFPMLLKVLSLESDKLGAILEQLDKPDLLWSPYGLRSLSKSSPLYMKHNSKDDPPYWRGQVWLNVNYLALAALRHYAAEPGPHAARAHSLHKRLRDSVVQNVLKEYRRTGQFWEHYSGEDGSGGGWQPFTGTSLIVLIMADLY